MNHVIPFAVAAVGTFIFILISYNFALSINLTAIPNNRKRHEGAVPLIGGIAIVFGFSLACLLSPRGLSEWRPLFLCMIPLVVIGVLDDHGDISVTKRILVQILSCIVMIYHGGIVLMGLGDITGFGPISLNGFEAAVTIISVVGVINALNLIDGIDGLCACLCLIAFTGIIILVKLFNSPAPISLILYFSSGIIAFLFVNLGLTKKYLQKVFLGDSGTTIIGFFLCWYLIKFTQSDHSVFRPVTAVWLLALPIMDTIRVIITRLMAKKSPFKPAVDHIHHLIIGVGVSRGATLLILVIFASLIAAIGIIGEIKNYKESYMFYGLIIIFILYFYISNQLVKKANIIKH